MQIARLLETVYILLEKRTMTARALADYFEVSIRTIYRDIDVLSQAGIPIYTTKGKGGGISLMDHYILNRSLLTKEEQEEILTSLSAMRQLQNNNQQSHILKKMTSIFQKEPLDWIDVDFHDWIIQDQQEKFDQIKRAIFDQRILSFSYMNMKGQDTERSIEPMKLVFKGQSWYVWGYCLKRKDERFFKLTRMRSLRILDQHYLRRDLLLHMDVPVVHKTIYVKLKVNKKSAFRILDEFPYQDMQIIEDHIFLETEITDQSWILDYLLSFGNQLEILEPFALRKALKERIASMQELYE